MNLTRTQVRCGACGEVSEQILCAADIDQNHLPDLDSRPNGPARQGIAFWMQRCPHCGYCAADVSVVHENAIALLGTEDYHRVLLDERFPEKAREFLAHARICGHVGQPADAGWCCLHAAWFCDDRGETAAATNCRALALDYWKQAKLQGEEFSEGGMEYALVTDVLRRMGRFEDALIHCSQALDANEDNAPLPPVIEHVLRFEKTLVQKHDTGTYRLSDLPAFRNRAV